MPQNVTSYGGTRSSSSSSSVHHHTSRSGHHGPRSTGWLKRVVYIGCQATATGSADVTALHTSLTATPPRLVNGMASPADGIRRAQPAGSVLINGGTGPNGVAKNPKANQSRPKRRFKENGTKRRRMKNPKPPMSNPPVEPPEDEDWDSEAQEVSDGVLLLLNPPVEPPKEEDWESEIQAEMPYGVLLELNPPVAAPKEKDWESEAREVMSTKWEEMFGVEPYGPEDVSVLALKDMTLTQEDSVSPASFQPARDHPEPVQWLRLTAFTVPDQFTDAADH